MTVLVHRVIIIPECECAFLEALMCAFENKGKYKYQIRRACVARGCYKDFCRQFNWYDCIYSRLMLMTLIFDECDMAEFYNVVDECKNECDTDFRISANLYHCRGRSKCFVGCDSHRKSLKTVCDDGPHADYYDDECPKSYYSGCSIYYDGHKKWVNSQCGKCCWNVCMKKKKCRKSKEHCESAYAKTSKAEISAISKPLSVFEILANALIQFLQLQL